MDGVPTSVRTQGLRRAPRPSLDGAGTRDGGGRARRRPRACVAAHGRLRSRGQGRPHRRAPCVSVERPPDSAPVGGSPCHLNPEPPPSRGISRCAHTRSPSVRTSVPTRAGGRALELTVASRAPHPAGARVLTAAGGAASPNPWDRRLSLLSARSLLRQGPWRLREPRVCGSGSAALGSGISCWLAGGLGVSEVLGECGARSLAAVGVWKMWGSEWFPSGSICSGLT